MECVPAPRPAAPYNPFPLVQFQDDAIVYDRWWNNAHVAAHIVGCLRGCGYARHWDLGLKDRDGTCCGLSQAILTNFRFVAPSGRPIQGVPDELAGTVEHFIVCGDHDNTPAWPTPYNLPQGLSQ